MTAAMPAVNLPAPAPPSSGAPAPAQCGPEPGPGFANALEQARLQRGADGAGAAKGRAGAKAGDAAAGEGGEAAADAGLATCLPPGTDAERSDKADAAAEAGLPNWLDAAWLRPNAWLQDAAQDAAQGALKARFQAADAADAATDRLSTDRLNAETLHTEALQADAIAGTAFAAEAEAEAGSFAAALAEATAGASPAGPAPAAPAMLAAPPTGAPEPAERRVATPVHDAGFASALGAQLNLLVDEGVTEARLHLHPAEMGPIQVRIEIDGQTARVEMVAEQAATRQALEQAMPVLAGALRDSGLTLAGGGVFEHARGQADAEGARGGPARGPGGDGAEGEPAPIEARPAPLPRGMVDVFA